MNKEIMDAMNKETLPTKPQKVKKWWRKNGYKVWRIVLFPVYIGSLIVDNYNKKANAAQIWNEQRTKDILSYYIPRSSDWDEKNKCFYFFDNGCGWGNEIKKINRKDRRYWKVHCGWFGGDIRRFLIDKFELEDFTKEVGVCDDGWTSVTFVLNK